MTDDAPRRKTRRRPGIPWAALAALTALSAFSAGAGALRAQDDEAFRRPFQLTEAEKLLAIQLTDQALTSRELRNGSPLYLVETELVREKPEVEGLEGKRLARITHYRYDGDLSIFTLIDLAAGATRQMEVIPHQPVPFSVEEYRAASELVLTDPRVRAILGERVAKVKVEGLALRTADPKDRYFGHRVLRMLFKYDNDYITRPIAMVDLTAQTVIVEDPGKLTREGH